MLKTHSHYVRELARNSSPLKKAMAPDFSFIYGLTHTCIRTVSVYLIRYAGHYHSIPLSMTEGSNIAELLYAVV